MADSGRQLLSRAAPWLAIALVAAALYAILDPVGTPLSGLGGYLALAAVGTIALAGAWRLVNGHAPRAVWAALLIGLSLRLLVGAGLYLGLPQFGYDTDEQNAGYVYFDAHARDSDAFARGRSDMPLWSAFTERKASDQYGGLLFISATVYRYLTVEHRPLLMVMLAAFVASSAIALTWGFAALTFGGKVGLLAAWLVAVYPEAVLLGASQMREAFVIPAIAMGLFAFAWLRAGDRRRGGLALIAAVALSGLVSPPYALAVIAIVGAAWLIERGGSAQTDRWLLGGLIGGAALLLAFTLWAWSNVGGLQPGSLADLVARWFSEGAAYQLTVLEQGSGWVQKLFEVTPAWAHMPMATAYGLSQPFLPAAVADNTGAAIWRIIAVWRAIGWFVVLPLLLYAPLAVLSVNHKRRLAAFLVGVAWLAAVVGSYRAAGDLWDNPRYRAALISVQAVVATWAFVRARQQNDRRLLYIAAMVAGCALLFLQWYLGRYAGTPALELEPTLAACAGLIVAVAVGGWWANRRKIVAESNPDPGV